MTGVLLAILYPGTASAQLRLSDVVIEFAHGKAKRHDIHAINDSKDTLYVKVKPSEIVNPGLANEKRVAIEDPRKLGLLVTPNKFILSPKSKRLLRFVSLRPAGDRDRIYRVQVVPAPGKFEAEGMALRVMVGYEVLLIVRPKNPKPAVTGKRTGKILSFRNEGNTSVLLRDGEQCREDGTCSKLPAKRLYAGQEWSTTLPHEGTAQYALMTGSKVHVRRFP